MKKEFSQMSVDELYTEKRMLDKSFFETKTLVATLSIILLTIALAIYSMKDSFSYILAALIIWLIYSVVKKFMYRNQIIIEIKSRN